MAARLYPIFLLFFFAASLLHAAGVKDPMRRADVPANGHLIITDYGYRNWGPELVNYTIDTKKFRPGTLVLLNPDGKAVPFQIDGNSLSFVASVAKGGTSTYALHTTMQDYSAANTTLTWAVRDKVLEVRNEFLTVRMPAPEKRSYVPPIAAADAPAPILQWNASGQGWMGGAHFHTARKVSAVAFSIVRQGAAVIEYEARYTFTPGGEYVWRLRLSPGMPIAIVSEEFDMGEMTNGDDMLILDLHRGWQPANFAHVATTDEQRAPKMDTGDYAQYVANRRSHKPDPPSVGGAGEEPAPYQPAPDLVPLEHIFPAGTWGSSQSAVQVWDGNLGQPGAGRNIALVGLSIGSWRHAMALNAWYQDGSGLLVALPISVRYSRWSLEVTDDHSPFSTHEHDPGLSFTYGRRVWGLYTGTAVNEAQARFGYIGLDRYKDWLIDYPDGQAARNAYPGAWFRADLVQRLRGALDQHPQAGWLQKRYLLSGKTEDAIANAQEVIDGLKKPYPENDLFLTGLSFYRKTQLLMFVNRAEDALACPDLPPDLRHELRLRLALYANIISDPDWNPRGAGVHLGNNNMAVNRTLALSQFAPLLPDHPRYRYWMDHVREYTRFKLASQITPDGVYLEPPTYMLYAPAQALNISLNVLRNRGYDTREMLDYYRSTLTYLANLTMPDPRFDNKRILPGMGNSGNQQGSIWGISEATFADDPQFAGWLKYIFDLSGQRIGAESTGGTSVGHAMFYLPDQPENPRPLVTTFLPAYGVVFRNQFNTPNETAMLFRAGMNWGHWDPDPLNVILYGKGAPLSPGTQYQYYSGAASQDNNIYHNQVKIGTRNTQECFGRVDGTVTDYGFGLHADYAVASRFYPSQIFDDGKGPSTWNRHVLFLKSTLADGEDYFVMRDTFAGAARPTWWEWLNLDTADLISVDGVAFDPEKVAKDKNVPEGEFQSLRGQTLEMKTKYGASTWCWFSAPRDIRTRMTFRASRETKTIVDIPGAPVQQDFFYLVYPRKDGAPVPECSAPAPGVMRITTAESTDTVFLGDTPFAWEQDGITFTGKAGAVRVFPDRVALCMNAGSGRIGYRGYILEGNGPFERVIKLAGLMPGVRKITGGYVKQQMTVDLGKGVRITGEGPFSAKLDGETISINTSGRARVLHVTQPSFIVRPQYWIDGKEWMACWTDYPNNGWGRYDNTWLIGLSVPEGKHELVIKDQVFPQGWTRPFTPLIDRAFRRNLLPPAE